MNITLSKYINYLFENKQDRGFTLIELLAVLIIIGILAALVSPSLFQQIETARTAEARQFLGALNRAQQAHFFEHATFAADFLSLGTDLSLTSNTYTYEIVAPTFSTEIHQKAIPVPPFDNDLKTLEGAVFRVADGFDSAICIGILVTDDPNITNPINCNNGEFIK